MTYKEIGTREKILIIIGGSVYLTLLAFSYLFTFSPEATWVAIIEDIVIFIIAFIIIAGIWFVLSQVGIRRASDDSIRDRGRFIPKLSESALSGSIILLSIATGIVIVVLGIPQLITSSLFQELEKIGFIRLISDYAPFFLLLLIVGPFIGYYLYNMEKNKRSN